MSKVSLLDFELFRDNVGAIRARKPHNETHSERVIAVRTKFAEVNKGKPSIARECSIKNSGGKIKTYKQMISCMRTAGRKRFEGVAMKVSAIA